MRTLRVKLPSGSVRLVEPNFAGRLPSFTLAFRSLFPDASPADALMPFAAVARNVGESAY
ncbi:hypothetical protein A8M77_26950 [Variovorax sp. JS1663]|nr:hypothetical protein A8M77_26950 [Variovorax sp. JS1663]